MVRSLLYCCSRTHMHTHSHVHTHTRTNTYTHSRTKFPYACACADSPRVDAKCVLCTVYCTPVYCALCTVLCTLYCVLCPVYSRLCVLYCVLCTVYCVLWTVYCALCTCVRTCACTAYCILCAVLWGALSCPPSLQHLAPDLLWRTRPTATQEEVSSSGNVLAAAGRAFAQSETPLLPAEDAAILRFSAQRLTGTNKSQASVLSV